MRQEREKREAGWVLWFVGLPGAGKTTYARAVHDALRERGEGVRYLAMDERRRVYSPNPTYTPQERAKAYRLFVEDAAQIAHQDTNVIMDGTAPKRQMRRYAREVLPRFAEVLVRCSLETAMKREGGRPEGHVMADLYRKALEREETGGNFEGLGEVIGVDTPFEEDPMAECVIDSEHMTVEEGRDLVLAFLLTWGSEAGSATGGNKEQAQDDEFGGSASRRQRFG